MIKLKRILVPHDFSETSDAAVKYAVAFAKNFGAALQLLHVSDKARLEMGTEFPLGLEASLEAAVRERMLKILAPEDQAALRPEFQIREGTPAVEVVRYAKEHDIDLIIMGTHGRGFIAHAVLGSVAEKVVRTAPCPVLTVHSPEREFVRADDAAQPEVRATT